MATQVVEAAGPAGRWLPSRVARKDRMQTTALFDDAWRDLQKARREENIDNVIEAADRLGHASRMMRFEEHSHEGVVCDHTPDRRGVCTKCSYNFSQFPA